MSSDTIRDGLPVVNAGQFESRILADGLWMIWPSRLGAQSSVSLCVRHVIIPHPWANRKLKEKVWCSGAFLR